MEERKVTTKKNGYYLLENLEEEDKKLTKKIDYTTSRLYTIEPENVSMVYCEGYQQFCSIEKTGDHQYKLHLPDNKTNEYFYEDGKLVLVKIHRTLVSLTFKLR